MSGIYSDHLTTVADDIDTANLPRVNVQHINGQGWITSRGHLLSETSITFSIVGEPIYGCRQPIYTYLLDEYKIVRELPYI